MSTTVYFFWGVPPKRAARRLSFLESSSLAGGSWKAMVCGMFGHLRPKGLGTSTAQCPGGRKNMARYRELICWKEATPQNFQPISRFWSLAFSRLANCLLSDPNLFTPLPTLGMFAFPKAKCFDLRRRQQKIKNWCCPRNLWKRRLRSKCPSPTIRRRR